MARQQVEQRGFILCIGFMALVSTIALKPRDSTSSSIAGRSGFMNGSPPVKPISLRAVAVALDLVEIGRDLGGGEIDQPVVASARIRCSSCGR